MQAANLQFLVYYAKGLTSSSVINISITECPLGVIGGVQPDMYTVTGSTTVGRLK